MYDGDVFTYRNDRASRQTAVGTRPQRLAQPSPGREEPSAAQERTARLEARVSQLEESLAQLAGVVQRLSEAAPPLVYSQHQLPEEEPVPPPPARVAPVPGDVKVSLFAGSSTEAILGQVRVTHQG